jgi:dipeptidyl aminopeptidase/acylaminoacyl peptidase
MQVQTIGSVVPSPDAVDRVHRGQARRGGRAERAGDADLLGAGGWVAAFSVDARREEFERCPLSRRTDGSSIFTSDRSGKSNLYRVLVEGGEAEMLTDVKGAMGEYKVSPDGKSVAYTGYEPPADVENRTRRSGISMVDSDPENMALYTDPGGSQ